VKGRARTGPGRPSALPPGPYSSPEPVRHGEAGAEVTFTGDDGRRRVFDTAELALPGWRAPVAAALAARTGITGGLRTLASAESTWQATRRFVSFLSVRQPLSRAFLAGNRTVRGVITGDAHTARMPIPAGLTYRDAIGIGTLHAFRVASWKV
jgi:hypothetical protein